MTELVSLTGILLVAWIHMSRTSSSNASHMISWQLATTSYMCMQTPTTSETGSVGTPILCLTYMVVICPRIVFNADGQAMSVSAGNRFVKFTTSKGRRVTSLGVLYNFAGNDVNTTVQFVANMVKESWFTEAIAEEPDVFILVGHMPVSQDNWPVFNAIRAEHPLTPIMIFGGHTHIRDCQQYDGRSMALESGRYMETIGWTSADLDAAKSNTKNITFSRRYLDQNRVTYQYHTKTSNQTFHMPDGRSITEGLQELAEQFDLSYRCGIAPQDYTMTRNPYPFNGSLLSLFIGDAIPTALAINNTRVDIPNIMITNSGGLRFDIFKGFFTKHDQLTASSFTDLFLYIPIVTFSTANKVLSTLNQAGAAERKKRADMEIAWWGRDYVEMNRRASLRVRKEEDLTLGYVTSDSCPGTGDDTPHVALPYYSIPDFIGSTPPNVTNTTPIDLIFIDYIETQLLQILNSLQYTKNYTKLDVLQYSPVMTNEVFGLFAQAKWN